MCAGNSHVGCVTILSERDAVGLVEAVRYDSHFTGIWVKSVDLAGYEGCRTKMVQEAIAVGEFRQTRSISRGIACHTLHP